MDMTSPGELGSSGIYGSACAYLHSPAYMCSFIPRLISAHKELLYVMTFELTYTGLKVITKSSLMCIEPVDKSKHDIESVTCVNISLSYHRSILDVLMESLVY